MRNCFTQTIRRRIDAELAMDAEACGNLKVQGKNGHMTLSLSKSPTVVSGPNALPPI